MDPNFPLNHKQVRDLLKFANKSPELLRLKQECDDINKGKRHEISQKVVDDAFDAVEIIIKNVTDDKETILKLQKLIFKYVFYLPFICKKITIED